MNALQVAHGYFDAWNQRDADAIVASFASGGTYSDPSAGENLQGDAIAAYAKGLWSAFPDLSFETVSAADTGGGLIATQWIMHGTNTGSMWGLPPTGRAVTVPGAEFIQVEGNRIRCVQAYFDSRAVPEQLGLQVIVQSHSIGPFWFGTSTAVQTGKKIKPGAFSITGIEARSDDEVREVRELSRRTAVEMLPMTGFIGWVGMTIGNRMLTVPRLGESGQSAPAAATWDSQGSYGSGLRPGGARSRRGDQRLDSGVHRRDVGQVRDLRADGRLDEGAGQVRVRRNAARADAVLVGCSLAYWT